jgi:protein SCO1/2
MTSPRYLLAALFVVIGLAGGSWFLTQALEGGARAPQRATVLPVAQPLPEFSLRDDQGGLLTRASLTGGWHLLFFGFTNCPDICPVTLQQLATARRRLADDDQSPLPGILLISVDPERDSPEVLADYVSHFGDGVRGATGSIDELRTLTSALGIHFEKAPSEPSDNNGNYAVNHSAAVLVIDPQARLKALFGAPHSIDAFVSDLPLILSKR